MEKFTYINEIDYDESITSESPFPEWIKTGELLRCQASRLPASTTELNETSVSSAVPVSTGVNSANP